MGTNIEKIKEQGNQAAPLLTELHDNELVISCDEITVTKSGGTIQNVKIQNLRGRQKVISILEKFKKGEIEAKDINLKFIVSKNKSEILILPIHIGLNLSPYAYFDFTIIVAPTIISDMAPLIFEFGYASSLTVKKAINMSTGDDYEIITEFID